MQTRSLIVTCIATLVATLYFLIQYLSSWVFLGMNEINFGDLGFVVECGQNNQNFEYYSQGHCSDYMYGTFLLKIIELSNLPVDAVPYIGFFFIFSISFIFSWLTFNFKRNVLVVFAGFSCLIAPPTELILQRANLDILMYLLVFLSALLMAYRQYVFALSALTLTTLIKFYTFPVLFMLSVLFYNLISRKKLSQLYLLPIFIYTIYEIYKVPYFPAGAQNYFGSQIFGEYIWFVIYGPFSSGNILVSSLIGFVLFIICLYIFVILQKKYHFLPQIKTNGCNSILVSIFLLNFLTFFSCYFAGLNIDYRLIFITTSFLAFVNIDFQSQLKYRSILVFSLVVVLFTSYNTYFLQPVGDVFLMVLTSYFSLFLYSQRKNVLRIVFV